MNGMYAQINTGSGNAADNRHPAIITRVATATGVKANVGDALFQGTAGAVLLAAATAMEDSVKGDGTATVHTFRMGDIVPGSVEVNFKGTKVKDNGNGGLVESDKGSAVIDYATGRIAVTTAAAYTTSEELKVKAVSAGEFLGLADYDMDDVDDGVNVVIHGSVVEGVAKFNGEAATSGQVAFLSRHGIY